MVNLSNLYASHVKLKLFGEAKPCLIVFSGTLEAATEAPQLVSLDLSVICSSSLAIEQFLTHFALLECLFIPIFYSLCGDYNWLGTRDHLLFWWSAVLSLSPLEHSLLLWLVGSIFFLKRLFPLGRSLIVVAKQTDKKYLGRYKNGLSPIQEFIICTLVVTERNN